MGNEQLTPWFDNVAFVYRTGYRSTDNQKPIIVGCWDGTKYRTLFDIFADERLINLHHAALNWLAMQQAKKEG